MRTWRTGGHSRQRRPHWRRARALVTLEAPSRSTTTARARGPMMDRQFAPMRRFCVAGFWQNQWFKPGLHSAKGPMMDCYFELS